MRIGLWSGRLWTEVMKILSLPSFDTLFEGMFEKKRFLDIIQNFICFSKEGKTESKILAGYHQYYAVRKAIESTSQAVRTDGKGGVFLAYSR